MISLKVLLKYFIDILKLEKSEHCKIGELIQFCQTILRKLESNEPLAQNEKTFSEYISMVSQILGMLDKLKEIEGGVNSKIKSYNEFRKTFSEQFKDRYKGFMNYMNFSSCFWPSVSAGGGRYKSSGGGQKTPRIITKDDHLTMVSKGEAMNLERSRSLNEFKDISEQHSRFLKRLSDLKSFRLDIIRKFSLESPSSEFSFFLSDFNQNHFEKFQYKFKVFDKMFQLLKAEIDAFNHRVMSEIQVCSSNTESIYPIIHHNNWIKASITYSTFYGKKD